MRKGPILHNLRREGKMGAGRFALVAGPEPPETHTQTYTADAADLKVRIFDLPLQILPQIKANFF